MLALLLGALVVGGPARADTPSAERAVFELRVNGESVGDTVVLLLGSDVLVPVASLKAGGVVGVRGGKIGRASCRERV